MGFGIGDVKALFDEGEDMFSGVPGSPEDLASKMGVSVPSVPTKSPVFGYPSIKQGLACQEVILRYNLTVLKLRVTHMTAEEMAAAIARALGPIISMYMELEELLDIDLSVGGLGSTPSGATDKMPKCLTKWAKSLAAIEEMQNSAGGVVSGTLDDLANTEAAQAMSGMLMDLDSFLSEAIGDISELGDDIMSLVNGLSDMIGNIHDNLIFPIVQALEEFVLKSLYAEDIAELLEMKKCIENNCKPGVGSMMDLFDIIYIDASKTKGFIVPIEPGNGEVLISKLYNQDKEGSGLNKPHHKDALKKIQTRYKNWKGEKQKAQDAIKKNAEGALGSEISIDSLPGMGGELGDMMGGAGDVDLGSFGF